MKLRCGEPQFIANSRTCRCVSLLIGSCILSVQFTMWLGGCSQRGFHLYQNMVNSVGKDRDLKTYLDEEVLYLTVDFQSAKRSLVWLWSWIVVNLYGHLYVLWSQEAILIRDRSKLTLSSQLHGWDRIPGSCSFWCSWLRKGNCSVWTPKCDSISLLLFYNMYTLICTFSGVINNNNRGFYISYLLERGCHIAVTVDNWFTKLYGLLIIHVHNI